MSPAGTCWFTVSTLSGRKVQLKANATSCTFADGNHLFYMNTSDSGPIENHTEPLSGEIRGYWSRSYQRGSVLAGEEWEWCWWFLIWLYLEDNVNGNWVLLLVQSKCRGRLRHLRKSREATFQGKPFHFINIRAIPCHMLFGKNKIIEGTQRQNIRVYFYKGKIQVEPHVTLFTCLVYLSPLPPQKYRTLTIAPPKLHELFSEWPVIYLVHTGTINVNSLKVCWHYPSHILFFPSRPFPTDDLKNYEMGSSYPLFW